MEKLVLKLGGSTALPKCQSFFLFLFSSVLFSKHSCSAVRSLAPSLLRK